MENYIENSFGYLPNSNSSADFKNRCRVEGYTLKLQEWFNQC